MIDIMSDAEVGKLLEFRLAEAYSIARQGEYISTIEPVEFCDMSKDEKRHHRSALRRIARDARRANGLRSFNPVGGPLDHEELRRKP